MMDMMVGLLLGIALLCVGGGLAVRLLVRFGKLEWVPTPTAIQAAFERGCHDRQNGNAFAPPLSTPISAILISAYHRGYAQETHRIETQRLQNMIDGCSVELEGSKREGLRLLRELHTMGLPCDLQEATLGRVVYLLGRELRVSRIHASMVEAGADEAFGPMSQNYSAPSSTFSSSTETHQQIH
jgi:hypothetical protein